MIKTEHFTRFENDIISWENFTEYDEKGNEIHSKSFNKGKFFLENFKEYDDKNNLIKKTSTYLDNQMSIETYKYDDRNRIIEHSHENLKSGYISTETYIYDDKNRTCECKRDDKNTILSNLSYSKYDERSNEVYYRSLSHEEWSEYNKDNKIIHFASFEGHDFEGEYSYEEWYEYDKHGNLIHSWDTEGDDTVNEYNGKGKLITTQKENKHAKTGMIVVFYHYDSEGRLTDYHTNTGEKCIWEYTNF